MKKYASYILKIIVAIMLVLKIYWLLFVPNVIFIQMANENAINFRELELTLDEKKYDITLENSATIIPESVFFKLKPGFIHLKVKDKMSGKEKELTFLPFIHQWIVIDLTDSNIKIKKLFIRPVFQ